MIMTKSNAEPKSPSNARMAVVILLVLLSWSCNDQDKYENSKSAKDWFLQKIDLNTKALARNKSWGELVDWNNSRSIDNNITEVPLLITGKREVYVSLNSNKSSSRNDKNASSNQIQRSVAFYKKENGFIVSEIRFIPTKEYIDSNPNGMNRIGLSSIPDNYSGLLLVYDYKTLKLKGGISYKDGKATGETETVIPLKQGGRTEGCTSYSIDYYTGVGDDYWYAGTDTYWFCTVSFPSYNKPLSIEPADEGRDLGGSSAWNSEEEDKKIVEELRIRDSVYNKIENPCIREMVVRAVMENLDNKVTNIINQVFANSDILDLSFHEDATFANTTLGEADVFRQNNGRLSVDIYLNINVLLGASQEMILATIIHEVLHGYLAYTRDPKLFNDHEEMAESYVNFMKSSLLSLMPNLPPTDAEALAWGGLHETSAWKKIVDNNPTKSNEIIKVNENHTSGLSGSKCN